MVWVLISMILSTKLVSLVKVPIKGVKHYQIIPIMSGGICISCEGE